ncbi:MAG: twin-arginine translocase TatA/TatE family subunit [Actinomycetota bacterium]
MLAIFQQIGLPEIILILAVLLLLFGARKLPELARSLGKSTKEFKQGMRDSSAQEPGEPEKPETPEAPDHPEKTSSTE